jgi:glycosyltransferase involved in cell wall biosynthesis
MDEGKVSLSLAVFTRFHPSIGGIETVAELLARSWATSGHRVTIVTDVAEDWEKKREFPFEVIHRPSARQQLRVVRNCDLVVHHNVALKSAWPLLFVKRCFVAVNHDRYYPRERTGKSRPWRERVKVWVARHWSQSVCVSEATRQSVGCAGPVIHDPYDEATFHNFGRPRDKDLVFLGRLVSDKGVNVLLDAVAELKRRGVVPSLTIIGEGPERPNIERQICNLELANQVAVLGQQRRDEVVNLLNRHKILVVPSIFDEGFGVVALEGIACGCVVVGSMSGGLPEAIGPCGEVFPKGDHLRLAEILAGLLENESVLERHRRGALEHLRTHRPDIVAAKYLEFFNEVLREGARSGSALLNSGRHQPDTGGPAVPPRQDERQTCRVG